MCTATKHCSYAAALLRQMQLCYFVTKLNYSTTYPFHQTRSNMSKTVLLSYLNFPTKYTTKIFKQFSPAFLIPTNYTMDNVHNFNLYSQSCILHINSIQYENTAPKKGTDKCTFLRR